MIWGLRVNILVIWKGKRVEINKWMYEYLKMDKLEREWDK